MNILGIESSCDDTAAAVVKNGRKILASAISTQFEVHRKYSGVVPELASRAHVTLLNDVIEKVTKKAGIKNVDAIAVTVGPGLAGSLLVGKMSAEALGWVFQKPVIGVNHIEGHLLSPVLQEKKFAPPFLGLVVSGGHTELISATGWGKYALLGRTRDDAAGEAFDKVAKMMDLGYPGGPTIDRMAKCGNPERFPFPKPWLPGTWDFSFSGLKTAVLYKLREKKVWSQREKRDICAGFQQAVTDVLVGKTLAAARALGVETIVVGGGVAANSQFRKDLLTQARKKNTQVLLPPPGLCTDNAAMIASAAYFKIKANRGKVTTSPLQINPQWHLPFLSRKIAKFSLSA